MTSPEGLSPITAALEMFCVVAWTPFARVFTITPVPKPALSTVTAVAPEPASVMEVLSTPSVVPGCVSSSGTATASAASPLVAPP